MLLGAEHLMTAMSIKLGPALKICEQVKALKDEIAKNWRQSVVNNVLLEPVSDNLNNNASLDPTTDGDNDEESNPANNVNKVDDVPTAPKANGNKKVVLKLGPTIFVEKEFLSESDDEENLVMDISDTEENLC